MKAKSKGPAEDAYRRALGRLRELLAVVRQGVSSRASLSPVRVSDGSGDPDAVEIVSSRDQVIARYQPIFARDKLSALTRDEFATFLYIENNRHWSGLYRHPVVMADMDLLRKALGILLDERRPIAERYTEAWKMLPGMGKGLATAILTVAFPERYGVWNNTSEGALMELGLWPKFPRGSTRGQKYEQVNAVLLRLAEDVPVDLWTLDALWWVISEQGKGRPIAPPPVSGDTGRFALESQLEDFLVLNWSHTELGRDWAIYEDEENDRGGQQYPTEVGRIDILAKHRREHRWLVIELKRDQTEDETVAQVLRYRGWVRKHLAKGNDTVEGLIIARPSRPGESHARLHYALDEVDGKVRLMYYEVEFRLKGPA